MGNTGSKHIMKYNSVKEIEYKNKNYRKKSMKIIQCNKSINDGNENINDFGLKSLRKISSLDSLHTIKSKYEKSRDSEKLLSDFVYTPSISYDLYDASR
mmetsp:Transcript_1877/g.1682  ORF Transcript_1877/g.1682 Transcript_1877/m.1682 type:complete len:99 (+) Transcript_1877:41-337(+)